MESKNKKIVLIFSLLIILLVTFLVVMYVVSATKNNSKQLSELKMQGQSVVLSDDEKEKVELEELDKLRSKQGIQSETPRDENSISQELKQLDGLSKEKADETLEIDNEVVKNQLRELESLRK